MGSSISQYQKKKRVSSLSSKQTPKYNTPISTRSPTTSTDSVIVRGRKYHGESSSVYWLPNDDEEMDRLVGVILLIIIERGKGVLIILYSNILL